MMQGQRDLETVSRMIMSRAHAARRRAARRVLPRRHARGRGRSSCASISTLRVQGAQDASRTASGSARGSSARRRSRRSASCSPRRRPTTSASRRASARRRRSTSSCCRCSSRDRSMAVIELASLPPVQRDAPGVPRAADRDDRRRAQHHRRRTCAPRSCSSSRSQLDRGAAGAVGGAAVAAGRAEALEHRAREAGAVAEGVRGAAPAAAGGAAADQRGARGEGAAARRAERARSR